MAKLTAKQQRFVDEYLIDLNATQAAIRAGYSEKTAFSIGTENLRKPLIQKAIQQRKQAREQRTEITQDRVIQELAAIGFARATDYAKIVPGGGVDFVSTDELTESQKAAVVSIKETQNGNSVSCNWSKLADKLKALELIGKHLGMFDRNTNGIDQEIEDDPLTKSIEKVISDGGRLVE